jgi:hypothetical protein
LENYWLKTIVVDPNVPDIPDKESGLFIMMNWTTRYISGSNTMLQIIDNVIV